METFEFYPGTSIIKSITIFNQNWSLSTLWKNSYGRVFDLNRENNEQFSCFTVGMFDQSCMLLESQIDEKSAMLWPSWTFQSIKW